MKAKTGLLSDAASKTVCSSTPSGARARRTPWHRYRSSRPSRRVAIAIPGMSPDAMRWLSAVSSRLMWGVSLACFAFEVGLEAAQRLEPGAEAFAVEGEGRDAGVVVAHGQALELECLVVEP